jgi:hypothetical protein
MSAANKKALLLSLVVTAVLSLLPISSHATVFWDDEMESGNSGYDIVPGAMSYDTSVKFSGNGSVRLNYPSECYPDASAQVNCGGYMDRNFPATVNLYRRFYIRLSAGFQVSDVYTKIMRSDTTGPNSNWWAMGCCGNRHFLVGNQNVPTMGSTTNSYANFSFPNDAQWHCVETHEQLNTPGTANGITQVWVDGTQVMNHINTMYRQAGDNSLFHNNRLYRQTGLGSIWYDRVAVGDQRIGCSGSPPNADTTPPMAPSGLLVR